MKIYSRKNLALGITSLQSLITRVGHNFNFLRMLYDSFRQGRNHVWGREETLEAKG